MAVEPECHETFWSNGQRQTCTFRVNGKPHRTDGPASEKCDSKGRPFERQFWVNGMLHRTDGPAWEWWSQNGRLVACEFYVNGKKLSEEAFLAWQERQQRQRELRALVFALENKFPAEAPEREFLRHILPAHVAGGEAAHVN